jgi:hypothetical protein
MSPHLSAIHSPFCKAIQAWFFTFGGAQAFQTILFILDTTRLKNCNLYAEAAEYWPFHESFQTISSSTSSLRCTFWKRAQSYTNCARCSIDRVASTPSFLIHLSSWSACATFHFFILHNSKVFWCNIVGDPSSKGALAPIP